MAARETKTLTWALAREDPPPELFRQRKRPEHGQFRLQVDRQTKGSYTTSETAEAAARVIKKDHPIVQVAVHDAVKSTTTIIELA